VYVEAMRKNYLKKIKKEIKKHGKGGTGYVAAKVGISYFQLYRICRGISQGTISTWEKIIKYYK